MADQPDPDRLRDLQARLAKARAAGAKPEKPVAGKAFSQGETAWRMVIELVSGMLIGVSIGYGLDWLFGTAPLFLVVFSLFGFAAGVLTMLRTARSMGGTQDDNGGSAG